MPPPARNSDLAHILALISLRTSAHKRGQSCQPSRRQSHDVRRDEDVADPLGLGVEAYRATAWEIGQLCDRVVDGVFVAGLAQSDGGARREGGV